MKIAIVGGGWAGLSAAISALDHGHEVHVYEAASRLGGRARSVDGKVVAQEGSDTVIRHPETIDNGQHILLGAYSATLQLMRRLGRDPDELFLHLPLNVQSADGTLSLNCTGALPPPLNIAAGFLLAQGLTLVEKLAVLRAMQRLRRGRWRTPEGTTVLDWLLDQRQPARVQTLLWQPLCIATLNTPVEDACAQLFANVLRDSLGSSDRHASDMLIPRVSLSELWPDSVLEMAAPYPRRSHDTLPQALRVRLSTTIKRISILEDSPDGSITLDDLPQRYDAVIVACNTPSAVRLLETLPPQEGAAELIRTLRAFHHAPIATLTLHFSRPWKLAAPMLMLHENRARGHFGQWLFRGQNDEDGLAHIVISDAGALASRPRKDAIASLMEQLKEQVRGTPMPPVTSHALITEKRATFLAVPRLKRPGHRTPWPGVWLAGDWTDTGYPAVLEGAVRSGRDAVMEMLAGGGW